MSLVLFIYFLLLILITKPFTNLDVSGVQTSILFNSIKRPYQLQQIQPTKHVPCFKIQETDNRTHFQKNPVHPFKLASDVKLFLLDFQFQ